MKKNHTYIVAVFAFCLSATLSISPSAIQSAEAASGKQCGRASWYDLTSRTASGEMMNPAKLTAAHKSLPFGAKVKVTNRNNGRSVIVRINDRGPFIKGRIVDLSKAAASKIGMIKTGHAPICMTRIG